MRFSSKLIMAATSFASSAYAQCFYSGEFWKDKGMASATVELACQDIIARGIFNKNEPRKYPIVNLIENLMEPLDLTFPSRYRLHQH